MTTTVADPNLLRDATLFTERLSELMRVVQFRDRDRACCYDVSVSQFYALKALVDRGALTVNDLAAALYLDKSTASRLAQGLEAKGYLARERDQADGRVVLLKPTGRGRALSLRIDEELAAEYADLLEDFTPEMRAAVVEAVSRLGRSFAARVEVGGGSCCAVP